MIASMTCPHGRRQGYLCPHCYGVSGTACSTGIVRISIDEATAGTTMVLRLPVGMTHGQPLHFQSSQRKRVPRPDPHPTDVKREQRQKMLADARKFRA